MEKKQTRGTTVNVTDQMNVAIASKRDEYDCARKMALNALYRRYLPKRSTLVDFVNRKKQIPGKMKLPFMRRHFRKVFGANIRISNFWLLHKTEYQARMVKYQKCRAKRGKTQKWIVNGKAIEGLRPRERPHSTVLVRRVVLKRNTYKLQLFADMYRKEDAVPNVPLDLKFEMVG